jgi:hypothetical protein
VILGYSSLYAPDDIEKALPDAEAARALIDGRRPDIPGRIDAMVLRATGGAGSPRHAAASLLGWPGWACATARSAPTRTTTTTRTTCSNWASAGSAS